MTGKRSLQHVLARQWMVFSLVLLAGFAAMALLLLYLLEDSFIDHRLRDVATMVETSASMPALPDRFEMHAADAAAGELRSHMQGLRPGGIREFRLSDGRYVHVLSGKARDGDVYWLLYDVSDQLRVNAALRPALPWLLLMAMLLALSAYGLASGFVSRISQQARQLLAQVAGSPDPARLQALARDESILEFSELARLNAQAWETQIATLQCERETLAFLGHELRTPLQSARTSLALLHEDRDNPAAWRRLQRAVDRLARASNGVLWLATEASPGIGESTRIGGLIDGLVEEFATLAISRQQTIRRMGDADASWQLPPEVVETVVANLLLNAIQHGGSGEIVITLEGQHLTLANPLAAQVAPAGFGLGLQVVQRLLARFGWALARIESEGRVVLEIAP